MIKFLIHKIVSKLNAISDSYAYADYRKKYALPPSFKFGGPGNVIYGDGDFKAGENSYINQVSIQISEGQKVIVGRNCRFSHNIKIYTESVVADQDLDVDPWGGINLSKKGDVVIGDGVWIGANVFINPGVTIGDNAVIGANSVVTKNIDAYAIAGGVPAKVIKYKSFKKTV
jgi:maltose O-acetyltransferase